MTLYSNMTMPDSQRYPWNLFSCNINAQVTFSVTTKLKIISFQNYKHWCITYTWSDNAFNGTVVKRAKSSLYGGSLENTLTVPLKIFEQTSPGLNSYLSQTNIKIQQSFKIHKEYNFYILMQKKTNKWMINFWWINKCRN